ncbi:hypothetical protein OG563_34840 [Nocardia vinacea]|uniref:Ribbon-helix-helix protein CopG domain-containing protein n=1 Tax=Nocardia vinacea TaxID=96468 RepID=A0ABZ1YJ85_9NOCA|nr:hypothetical protein [Nocardia vinacea]
MAAELVDAGVPVADAAHRLADGFGCSLRQARRYVDRAVIGGPMPVAQQTVVFSIKLKLPAALAIRVREHARDSGSTLSDVVSQALAEFLAPGRTRPGGR